MKQDIANKILAETEKGYDGIATKFSQTRKHFWRDLEFVRDYVHDGDKVLDFGCGNGRLHGLIQDKNVGYFGVDISSNLLGIAEKKYAGKDASFRKISSLDSIPFPDGFFNAVYSIATLHHIPSEEYRRKMINEFYRVLNPGGRVVISVWNVWQKKYFRYVLKNIWDKSRGRSELDLFDAYIPFKDNEGNIFQRYHHAFTKRELVGLIKQSGFTVEKSYSDRNVVVIGKKKINSPNS